MPEYFHSVRLDKDKCMGCTNCLKKCPTEAIRVRNGKAHIIAEKCIDCGECIRACKHHAKLAVTDNIAAIEKFKYRIALPAPSLYAQFKGMKNSDSILYGLKMLGFDYVFEVASAAEIVSLATRREILRAKKKPVISSACPAIVRLIQVRFPELLDHLSRIDSPMEMAARIAKEEFAKKENIKMEDIGAFFITPCPAKMTSILSPVGIEKSNVDGAISILEIYGLMSSQLHKPVLNQPVHEQAGAIGVGWAVTGGECNGLVTENSLSVDGIHNVIRVLEEVENGKLENLDFLEGLACTGGCVGGPLMFENPFVGKTRICKLSEGLKKTDLEEKLSAYISDEKKYIINAVRPRQIMRLDEDMEKAMAKMNKIAEIQKRLPGLDCGSCGAPSCDTLAEDIVLGYADELDCIFKLRDKVRFLAEEMVSLASQDKDQKS
ncbi:MAG: [Fe-Fe] hydrogenase large subunit C-terminal domain-containing protein [Christensenellales bacterium]